MSVYVDDMEVPYGRLVMCHMIADTHHELMAMVDRIGVQRRWLQQSGTPEEHFDIAKSKRALAVKAGAEEITLRELATMTRARWDGWPGNYFTAPAEGPANESHRKGSVP